MSETTEGAGATQLYSFLFGAGYGILVSTIPVALSRYFGAREFSKMFGVGTMLVGPMGGLGPWATAQISDHTSYTIPIYLITGLLGLSVIVAIAARPHGLRGGQTPAGLPAVPDPLAPDQG